MAARRRKPGSPSLLLFADSERSADQLYFSGFHAPDPFIAIQTGGRRIGVLSALEFGRAKRESRFDEVLALEELQKTAQRRGDCALPCTAEVIRILARRLRVRSFRVPAEFPFGLAEKLGRLGVKLEACEDALLPEREVKTDEEVKAIVAGNRCSAAGIATVESMLRRASVRRGRLFLDGRVLTSERAHDAVEIACLQAGGVANNAIVASGDQACDPHCRGSGALRAGELIIVDVFPRMSDSGYFGDMTRTFLKGAPSDAQVKLVETVRAAQKAALAAIRPGVHGSVVHRRTTRFFADAGYETRKGPEGSAGFFHGTGHGLGLEIHELPNLGRQATSLRKGAVVTVEPGLYYPGLGGCRIEDVVQVAPGQARLLSRFHYRWVIP